MFWIISERVYHHQLLNGICEGHLKMLWIFNCKIYETLLLGSLLMCQVKKILNVRRICTHCIRGKNFNLVPFCSLIMWWWTLQMFFSFSEYTKISIQCCVWLENFIGNLDNDIQNFQFLLFINYRFKHAFRNFSSPLLSKMNKLRMDYFGIIDGSIINLVLALMNFGKYLFWCWSWIF